MTSVADAFLEFVRTFTEIFQEFQRWLHIKGNYLNTAIYISKQPVKTVSKTEIYN